MLNGTLKDNEICHNCGEAVRLSGGLALCCPQARSVPFPSSQQATKYLKLKRGLLSFIHSQGHRIWNCPKREKWKPTDTAIPKEAQAAVSIACQVYLPLSTKEPMLAGDCVESFSLLDPRRLHRFF